MARKAQWPPPINVHKKTGWERIRIKDAGTGKWREVWLGPAGSEKARAEYARIVNDLAGGGAGGAILPPSPPKPPAPGMTVAEVVAAWWEEAEQTYSKRGRELEQFRPSLAPLLRLYGPTPAAAFDTLALEAVQRAMASGSWMNAEERAAAQKKRRTIGWCRNVVNRRIVRVRTVWRWAERKKLVPPHSFAHLCTLPGLGRDSRIVRHTKKVKAAGWRETLAVAKELYAQKRAPWVGAMLLLQWWSGMRSCEVRILRPADIDTSAPCCWRYTPSQHKNDWREDEQPRVVMLGPKCQALLRPWLARCRKPDQCVFPGHRRRPYQPYRDSSYAQAVRRAGERIGIAGLHPYRSRHAAKERITRLAGLDVARAVLGQKSILTTDGYGAKLDLDAAQQAARKLA